MHMTASLTVIATLLCAASSGIAQTEGTPSPTPTPTPVPLRSAFEAPSADAKPWTWWHWMGGNITQEGIVADLAWMKRAGLGGTQLFFDGSTDPKSVPDDKRIDTGSPRWFEMIALAAREAARNGLQIGINNTPGIDISGGAWVPPAEGMKKYVWTETVVRGGRPGSWRLPQPDDVPGPFQDVAVTERAGRPDARFYRDGAVFAYRTPAGERAMADVAVRVTSNSAAVQAAGRALFDGRYATDIAVATPTEAAPLTIDYRFDTPFSAAALTVTAPSHGTLFASDDGVRFREVTAFPGAQAHQPPSAQTISFPAVQAKAFRIVFTQLGSFGYGPPQPTTSLGEVRLLSGGFVNRWQEKASFGTIADMNRLTGNAAGSAIAQGNVIDLTAAMDAQGTLRWTPPAGRWTVVRMGYSPTGITVGGTPSQVAGLEADKLDPVAIRHHLDHWVKPIIEAARPARFANILTDSWERGQDNWGPGIVARFRERRGYDPAPWLPVLTGRRVVDEASSDKFLWDWRTTVSEMTAEGQYKTVQDYAHGLGMKYYAEAPGAYLRAPADDLLAKRYTDVPMGEFWFYPAGAKPRGEHPADVLEAASAAHVYGQNIAAAEAFTTNPQFANYTERPAELKRLADHYMTLGINKFIFHVSVLQTDDRKPGSTFGAWGTHFNRHMTWAEQATGLTGYLARSSSLLQQGRFVGDIAFFYGEGGIVGAPFVEPLPPAVPEGYAFDYVNADMVTRLMFVANERIRTPSGMAYRLIVLPDSTKRLSLPVIAKLRDLVRGGATVFGPKPHGSPSLSASDRDVDAIADELWGTGEDATVSRTVGAGRVRSGMPLTQVLDELGGPDFEDGIAGEEALRYIHRAVDGKDVYFVANATNRSVSTQALFRTTGKSPELWDPDTKAIVPVGYRTDGARTTVPLDLAPYGSTFVVFGEAGPPSRDIASSPPREIARAVDPWTVTFPPGWGAPRQVRMPALMDWRDSDVPGIRYFSGTARYRTRITLPARSVQPGERQFIDLGDVHEVSTVRINGKPAGIGWHAPYRIDVTGLVRPGSNLVEVDVSNLWPNRMIGDRVEKGKPYTWSSISPYKSDSPLLASGLLGPVVIFAAVASGNDQETIKP